jgi:hypothetical protein
MDLNEGRSLVRRDLHDEDPTAYRWSDAELERHIQHALRELSLSSPLQATATLSAVVGSRDLALGGLADLLRVEAAEYPVGQYPPAYVRFRVWSGTLTLLIDTLPGGGEPVRLFHTKLHLLDATSSTLPAHLEELVVMGAGAYAALEWASFATNRVNVGGPDTWRHYLAWGRERLAIFQRDLARLAANNIVRPRRLYTPVEPRPSQSTDWGP